MKSGYHQIEVEETHKEKTAFTVGSLGFYEYNKMPFGLSNSPATYQRIMQEIIGDLNMRICLIYLDDLIIFSDTFEQHLENLDIILETLKKANLKLAPEKCFFFKPEIKFLGHVVSEKGIQTDPEKIQKVMNWPEPSNSDELRSFLAFAGYYRRFIKDFSRIAKPLNELLPPTSVKKGKAKEKKEWKWTQTEMDTFNHIKKLLSAPPVLAYPDFTKPFELHTDASSKALGAVLYQEQDGQKRVISFASRALNKSEQHYSAFKLEFLALKWAVTEKFNDYLSGTHFTVYTDNNPLTYILTSAKLDATGQRWASALSHFDFDIFYRAGLNNLDADGMSRYPYEKITQSDSTERQLVQNDTVKAICNIIVQPYIETLPIANINIVDVLEEPGQLLAQKDMREIRKAQRSDPLIERWRRAVIDNKIPENYMKGQDLTMKKQFKNFRMKRGILFREITEDDKMIEQLVIPECYRQDILLGLHNEVGHPGQERTTRLVRERYYWPGVGTDIADWVGKCERCIRRKARIDRAPLVNVHTSYPLELLCMDFLTLEPSKGNIGNILIITDHYTKFAKAIPTRNQTAKTTAEALYNEFIIHFGIPTRLHTDQGANFESEIISELCRVMNIKKSHTTPYHPQGNAGPERFNRTLLGMLGTLEEEQKQDWKKYINSLVYAYNCTPHEATRVSPFELMFGRKPNLPVDTMFEKAKEETNNKSTQEYIEDLQERLVETHNIIQKHLERTKQKQQVYYDKKAKACKISVGSKVLVKKLAFNGKHKIADRFEPETYLIVEQPRSDIPVFKVKSMTSDREKTLHRNHLLLIESQDDSGVVDEEVKNVSEETAVCEEQMEEIVVKDDVIVVEDSSDEESDNSIGVGYAGEAFQYGDAHKPPVEEESEDEEDNDTENDVDEDEAVEEDIDFQEAIVEMETDGIDTDETIEEDKAHGTETMDEPTEDPELPPNTADTGIEETATGPDKPEDLHEEKEEVKRPVPPPRRSVRDRKPPDRYGDPYMYRMVNQPVDRKIQALQTLMESGILNSVDGEIAHQLIGAVMK